MNAMPQAVIGLYDVKSFLNDGAVAMHREGQWGDFTVLNVESSYFMEKTIKGFVVLGF